MSQLGIFCTVARTELMEISPEVSGDTLSYLNHVAKNAYNLGLARAAEVAEVESWNIHGAAAAIRREMIPIDPQKQNP